MAKKKTKAKKQIKRHTITDEEYLEHIIKVSRNAITKQGTSIDQFFEQQAQRLEKQLEELKKSKCST